MSKDDENDKQITQNPFRNETKISVQEFYKNYCEESEKHFEDIFQRNEALNMKIVGFKHLEEEYNKLQKESANFKIFKKLSKRKGKNAEIIEFNNQRKLDYFNNFICENPKCIGTNVNYVELKREHDKMVVDNFNLKKYYFELKFKKNEKILKNEINLETKENNYLETFSNI